MKKSRLLQIAGIGLILCGLLALLISNTVGDSAELDTKMAVEKIRSVLPPAYPGVTDQYSNMDMPSFRVEGQDYIALLEVPQYGVVLPVRSQWNGLTAENCPSKFRGTVYDGSLIIGGSDKEGQLSFANRIENGDTVFVTDMTGGRFAYKVEKIFRADSAAADVLVDENFDLTIFAWSGVAMEYIVIRCVADIIPA